MTDKSRSPHADELTRPLSLSVRELDDLYAVADTLIPDGPAGARPSALAGYGDCLRRALAARPDCFDEVVAAAAPIGELPESRRWAALERLAGADDGVFDLLSTVVAGAYLLVPAVRDAIGYPGQGPRPPRFDEAADEIMNGILEPVTARGEMWRRVERDADQRSDGKADA